MNSASAISFVFDLDDTLYAERDYAISALRFAGDWIDARMGTSGSAEVLVASFQAGDRDAIGAFSEQVGVSQDDKNRLIEDMRAHEPGISLRADSQRLLQRIRQRGMEYSILTDGRSVTQRAKIAALGLSDARHVIVSEEIGATKPSTIGFETIAAADPGAGYVYVGDNPKKDFAGPNQLGWTTVMLLDRGTNIHSQSGEFESAFLPQHRIHSLDELGAVLGLDL